MFLVDESVDFGIVLLIRGSGFHVKCISEDSPSISDNEVLQIAVNENFILLTEDKDFGELVHRLRLPHRGILLIRLSELPRNERIHFAHHYIVQYYERMKNVFSLLNRKGLKISTI